MINTKAVIIDDEMHSRETTRLMLEMIAPEIDIVAIAANATQGAEIISKHRPDLIFLDVQMPGMTGVQMLDLIPEYQGEIIFITAHNQYAIDAFKKGALHYLLKPIDPNDLKDAIERVKKTRYIKEQKKQGNWLSLSSQEGWVVIKKEHILRCESFKNYTTIITENTKHTISKTLKDVELTLPIDSFYRVHASHIINIEHVDKILKTEGGNVLLKNGDLIPISKGKKKAFFDWFRTRIDSI
ncbi:MAG: response regulator [Saprospiraceae bacterium]